MMVLSPIERLSPFRYSQNIVWVRVFRHQSVVLHHISRAVHGTFKHHAPGNKYTDTSTESRGCTVNVIVRYGHDLGKPCVQDGM